MQLLDPWFPRGANRPSLVEAQATYASFGAMEERFLPNVKGVLATDVHDPQWRRAAEYDRAFVRAPRDLSDDEQRDLSAWYYWRKALA